MKKLTTKLLMSIIAVAFAFVALGTSTYAWFSMNTAVNLTGMQVTAKSNASYLLIGLTDNASDKTASDTTLAAANPTGGDAEGKVYPVSLATDNIVVGDATVVQSGKWYAASSSDPDTSNVTVTNYAVKELGATDYFITYKCYLTLSADSEPSTTKKIQVTMTKTSGDDSLSAYVVVGSALSANLNASNSSTASATSAQAVSLAKDSSIEVTIYIYMDGTFENINSTYYQTHTIDGICNLTFELVD